MVILFEHIDSQQVQTRKRITAIQERERRRKNVKVKVG